jgi:hypothetical protein
MTKDKGETAVILYFKLIFKPPIQPNPTEGEVQIKLDSCKKQEVDLYSLSKNV